MIELIKNPSIDFMGKRKISLTISAVFLLLGLVALLQISRGKANLGIDFVGGTAVQVHFQKNVSLQSVRSLLEKDGFHGVQIQNIQSSSDILIRTKVGKKDGSPVSSALLKDLRSGFPGNPMTILSATEIGPTIGNELAGKAFLAILYSIFGIIVYIAFRFEFRFGVAAAISTFHNVMAVLGILYLLGVEINLLVVTALLTLAGYSLTDTVVVFDRIREQLRRASRQSMEELINQGINQVLSRTVVVSSTVVLVLVALFFFGGPVIHDFSLALLLGVVIGTFASIFVASPLLLVIPKGKKSTLVTSRPTPADGVRNTNPRNG
ncbi:protein translocase subunit SecF [Leptospirillum ferriphilum]|jgi:preprotein translocase subunit SecF|uniref:Protein-export membrane protein SecF n=2 Tax=Leptospirillum TaxID=179 RepID=A0A094W865_9BACT|nr:protein translocase subunit SecF [Leptospirillum ferriphilum]EDZ39019.1 MAG: SecF export membrane protein [Leptospirillum sp. Group II '5-way CG']KGA93698.1 Protein-export membrane protein SecF [Leptospirillum ferriphilum]